jgi:spermidine synthase
MHGSTMHGEESLQPDRRGQAMSYYHRTGPIGQTLDALADRLQRVAVVGLGAGSLAAYARPGEAWTFFEIDPAVERLARDRRYFTFLDTCGDRCHVVLGDARLTLEDMKAARFDVIVLDAFSSDAIPTHLVTRQAFELYVERLETEGVLALHISNRHLRLEPLLGAIARDLGLVARVQFDARPGDADARSSNWIVMARSLEALGPLAVDDRWQTAETGAMAVWTDDYSNLLSVFELPRFGLP